MSTTVAVTGAAGSLGQTLVERLLAAGHRVKALVRTQDQAIKLERANLEVIVGDVRDEDALRRLLEGTGVAVHLAAWMGKPFDERLAVEVNVTATERLVRLAGELGVKRVVLASSVAVYGPVLGGTFSEASPVSKVGDLYSDTKADGEAAARAVAAENGVDLVVLRPAMIYGPGSGSWTVTPFEGIRGGTPMVIGSGEDLLNPVYITDVARAFEMAAFNPAAAGQTFNISGESATWNTFFGHYARMAGTALRRLPAPLAQVGAGVGERVTRALGKRPQIVAQMVGVMTSQATFSGQKAADVLGFKPEVNLDEGMALTEAWLREHGFVKRVSTALVTGAGSGLGQAIAKGLLEHGVKVWASDIRLEVMEALPDSVQRVALDVTSQASIDAALETIRGAGDRVDLLVNVAGLAKPGPLEAQAWDEVTLQFEVNAYGPLRLARALAPAMRERGFGRIVNISSTNGFVVTPFMGAYSASKFALEALSDSLRIELKPWGVDVIVIEPGAMKTPFAATAQKGLEATMDRAPDWKPYIEGFLKSSMWGTVGGTPPEKVAQTIIKAALAKSAPARVLATLDAIPSKVISTLPTGVKDTLFTRLSGLGKKPKRGAANG
jgi:nucleoside-diphosphate-sugar epimerase